jgi:hypothetical protein
MKYNAGDKVIYIFFDEKDLLTVSKEEIESVSIYIDKVEYYFKDSFCDPALENEIYTPEEAIEFLSNYINKND